MTQSILEGERKARSAVQGEKCSMELTRGIVCILCNYKRPAGTGFVVSTATEILIVTCAHVLGEPRPEHVTIVFQATGEQREAKVIDRWWSQVAEDVAILRIVGTVTADSESNTRGVETVHGR